MLIPYPWQTEAWQRLQAWRNSQTLPHGLLLAGPQGAGNGPQGGPPTFTDLDTNHDGVISQDEFQAGMPVPGQGFGPGPRR